MRAWVLVALLSICGCRREGGPPIDPNNPDALAPCPAGAHLAVALGTRDYESTQSLLRFTPSFTQCQGAVLPTMDYGDITTVGGLNDGSDLVGFAGAYGYGGTLARVDGSVVVTRLDDEELYPISISRLSFNGEDAVAVAWGSGFGSSSDSGERITVHSAADLAVLGSWDVSYQAIRVASPPTAQGARLAVLMLGAGMQEMRADPGATTLATTGELAVSMPWASGTSRSLDVLGSEVRASGDNGVLYWRSTAGNAFLGPVSCRWPDVSGSPLPMDDARYIGALIDPSDPTDRTIVLVDGELESGSDETTHVFALRHRGECELLFSIPDTHAAVAIAWSGR